jgi:hypothetical protein
MRTFTAAIRVLRLASANVTMRDKNTAATGINCLFNGN